MLTILLYLSFLHTDSTWRRLIPSRNGLFIQKLHEITLGMRDVATGHATEKVDVTGPKEIGDLAVAFNQMVERFGGIADEMSKVTMPKVETVEYMPSADVGIEEPNVILHDPIKPCCLG